MIWDEYPNSNVHELNLDWIIKKTFECIHKVNELEVYVKDKIDTYIEQYVVENLDKFILNASYVEETKTIKLNMEEVNL